MAIDRTGTFIGQPQGGDTGLRARVDPNIANDVFNGLRSVGDGVANLGVAIESARRSRDAADILRVNQERELLDKSIANVYEQYPNEPEKWEPERKAKIGDFEKRITDLKLSDSAMERARSDNALHYESLSLDAARHSIKYSAARDRSIVTASYDRLIESGQVEEAQKLVMLPEFKNVLPVGDPERLFEEAPKRAAAHETQAVRSTIQSMAYLDDVESLSTTLQQGSAAYLGEENIKVLRRDLDTKRKQIVSQQKSNGRDIAEEAYFTGVWLTDAELTEKVALRSVEGIDDLSMKAYQFARSKYEATQLGDANSDTDKAAAALRKKNNQYEATQIGGANSDTDKAAAALRKKNNQYEREIKDGEYDTIAKSIVEDGYGGGNDNDGTFREIFDNIAKANLSDENKYELTEQLLYYRTLDYRGKDGVKVSNKWMGNAKLHPQDKELGVLFTKKVLGNTAEGGWFPNAGKAFMKAEGELIQYLENNPEAKPDEKQDALGRALVSYELERAKAFMLKPKDKKQALSSNP